MAKKPKEDAPEKQEQTGTEQQQEQTGTEQQEPEKQEPKARTGKGGSPKEEKYVEVDIKTLLAQQKKIRQNIAEQEDKE